MRAFMRFLAENPNSVVPPVLLSARNQWEFAPNGDSEFGEIHVYGPAAIIDGQHRCGGFVALVEEEGISRPVSFMLLTGLTRKEEVSEFTTVNGTQKGVPKSLTAYLGESPDAQIAWALNEEPDSPFFNRITRTGMQRNHLFALHSVARQIGRLFSFGALADLAPDVKIAYAVRYWTIIADALPEQWADLEKLGNPNCRGRIDFEFKLLELTGLIAWCQVGKTILGRSYHDELGMNWENVTRLVHACAVVDWRKNGKYQGRTGEAGGNHIASEMERLLPPEVEA
jgi:DGQHR domain-containing protein